MGRKSKIILGVALDMRLTWSSHIDQVRRKASQRLGVLSPLLNKRNGLSIRNGLILYRQLIRPKLTMLVQFGDMLPTAI